MLKASCGAWWTLQEPWVGEGEKLHANVWSLKI